MPVNFSELFSNHWIVVIFGLLMAFVITWVAIPPIVYTARLKNMGAAPNGRTSHENIIPTLGGIAVFAGFVVSTVIFAGSYFKYELQYIISGLIIVFFIGIKDDITITDPWKKMAGQIISVAIIAVLADIRINNFYGLFEIYRIPYIPSVLFTIFVFLTIINGFNLIDGIDGLATGIGILTSTVFGFWFLMTENIALTILSFSLAGSLSAFFYFNVFSVKNKLFLGDTGSLVIGFVIAVLACSFLQNDTAVTGTGYIQSAPAVAIGILIVPLFDTLRVFVIRLFQGKSPFTADRQHLHHHILKLGITHLQATLILISANLVFIALSYSLQGIGIIRLTVVILGLATLMSYILHVLVKKKTSEKFNTEYVVEGTWTRKIRRKALGKTRHINNIILSYPEKVTSDINEKHLQIK